MRERPRRLGFTSNHEEHEVPDDARFYSWLLSMDAYCHINTYLIRYFG